MSGRIEIIEILYPSKVCGASDAMCIVSDPNRDLLKILETSISKDSQKFSNTLTDSCSQNLFS